MIEPVMVMKSTSSRQISLSTTHLIDRTRPGRECPVVVVSPRHVAQCGSGPAGRVGAGLDDVASVREKRIEPIIAHRGTAHGSGLGLHRWAVEQTMYRAAALVSPVAHPLGDPRRHPRGLSDSLWPSSTGDVSPADRICQEFKVAS
jgi:hypothetical protein